MKYNPLWWNWLVCVCLCVPHVAVAVEPMLSVISPTALTSASVPEGLTTSVCHGQIQVLAQGICGS